MKDTLGLVRTFERRTDIQGHRIDMGGAGGSSAGCLLRPCILKTSLAWCWWSMCIPMRKTMYIDGPFDTA